MDGWDVRETRFALEHARAWEGLFTLGSGYLHVRGSLEEHISGAPQNVTYMRLPANVTSEAFPKTPARWGTYVPGVFARHPLLNNQMVNLPWFLGITPMIDCEPLDMSQCDIREYLRVLHLDIATLVRTLQWRTHSGKRIELSFERFVSAAKPWLTVQRVNLRCDRDASLRMRFGIDADVRTNGYDHFADVTCSADGLRCACQVTTDAGDRILIASCVKCEMPLGHDCQPAIQGETGGRSCATLADATVPAAQWLRFEKRSALTTSRDPVRIDPADWLNSLEDQSFEQLHAEHSAVWKKRWQCCDVTIDGDDESQRAIRVALYHLLRAHVPDDPRVAIDAKGYAGEAYWGRYFWDTEMFLLPFFLYTDPAKAKTLTDFRVRSLPGAQENARRYGYPGARYAWESDAAGIECCPNWQYADHEIHVTADVVYSLVHYSKGTGDKAYLEGLAAKVLLETARYWMARVDQRPDEEGVSLLGVMGPDEYTPISNNNSFTNTMVAEALRAAADCGQHAGASAPECESFRRTADRLPCVHRKDGLVMQCEGFEQLAEARFDEFWKDRDQPFATQVSQERLYRCKALKQADVLMLMMLFTERFGDEQVRQAWDYYVPCTTHDSSLSAGVHAIVAARIGLHDQAWQFWLKSRAIDLDVGHGGAAEGIHIANAGAVWQMAVFGFGGTRTAMQESVLTFAPRLPKAWLRLAFPIIWKGTPVHVEVRQHGVRISNHGQDVLTVVVNGRDQLVAPGGYAEWRDSD